MGCGGGVQRPPPHGLWVETVIFISCEDLDIPVSRSGSGSAKKTDPDPALIQNLKKILVGR